MNEEQFRAEKAYQITMSFADDMLEKGIITRREYDDFDTKLLQKYKPIFGTLWSGIKWIKPAHYGNMVGRKP